MKAPLSILGTASQVSGSAPTTGPFYFSASGTDYGNLSEWFLDDVLTIPATRIPGSADDVVINCIPSDGFPSLGERTYKTIVFSPLAACWNGSSFYKSPVKFYTSTGDITGHPTSLIADLESAAGIAFGNLSGLDIAIHKLGGNWVSTNDITLNGYYHGDEPDSTPSQITCANYDLGGCLDFVIPGNSTTPNQVHVTQTASNPAYSVRVDRCEVLSINLSTGVQTLLALCQNTGDSITTVNVNSSDSLIFNSVNPLPDVNIYSGSGDEYFIDGNLSLYGSASIHEIAITGNLSYETEAQYIASRQAGDITAIVGQIYIGGYEHQKFTLSGGIITGSTYDILVYDGAGYNLYDAADSFTLVGRLNYTASWDLSFYASFDVGSWLTGSPPALSDWVSATTSPEPTWGTE